MLGRRADERGCWAHWHDGDFNKFLHCLNCPRQTACQPCLGALAHLDVQAQLDSLQRQRAAETAEAQSKLQQLVAKCDKHVQQAASLKQQLVARKEQVAARDATVEELQGQVARKEQAVGQLQAQIGDMGGLLQGMKAQCREQLAGIERLRGRVQQSEEEASELRLVRCIAAPVL